MLNDLYFKTTCNIRPHFLGPMGGLKIKGPLYNILYPSGLWLNGAICILNNFQKSEQKTNIILCNNIG